MMNYGDQRDRPGPAGDPGQRDRPARPARARRLGDACPSLIDYIAEKDPGAGQRGRPARHQALRQARPGPGDPPADAGATSSPRGASRWTPRPCSGWAGTPGPGKTRLSIISTKFLGADPGRPVLGLAAPGGDGPLGEPVARRGRLAGGPPVRRGRPLPARERQAADQGADGEPARSGPAPPASACFLATQSPGDFDYKCRDNIRSWFVGRVKEPTALAKMKPMLSECRVDVAARLADPGDRRVPPDPRRRRRRASGPTGRSCPPSSSPRTRSWSCAVDADARR